MIFVPSIPFGLNPYREITGRESGQENRDETGWVSRHNTTIQQSNLICQNICTRMGR